MSPRRIAPDAARPLRIFPGHGAFAVDDISLYEILQILSLTLFEKTPVNRLFDSGRSHNILGKSPNPLNLFN
jgi:hypothetical protein